MPLIKFAIDKDVAKDKFYLVAGNRIRLADVDSDLVAEKLFNAKVKGVSRIEPITASPAIALEESATDAEAPPATAKKR